MNMPKTPLAMDEKEGLHRPYSSGAQWWGRGGCTHVMYGRSCINIVPRIRTYNAAAELEKTRANIISKPTTM